MPDSSFRRRSRAKRNTLIVANQDGRRPHWPGTAKHGAYCPENNALGIGADGIILPRMNL